MSDFVLHLINFVSCEILMMKVLSLDSLSVKCFNLAFRIKMLYYCYEFKGMSLFQQNN